MRRYRVCSLGGGWRHFDILTSATAYARRQSAASWALEDWAVWDRFNDRVACLVSADGVAYDPFARAEVLP